MKLVSIQFPGLPMFGNLGHIRVEAPPHSVRGWTIAIRGPAVFMISPPGWTQVNQPLSQLTSGPRRIFEIARASCVEQWEGELSEIDSVTKWTGEPMMPPEQKLAAVEEGDAKVAGKK